MFGLVPQVEEKKPKWVETRTRITEGCVKVVRINMNAPVIVDPKGDFKIIEKTMFLCNGQLPFGEWLKKLAKNDVPPRGTCNAYFHHNAHLRS